MALLTFHTYAATPQQAAIDAVNFDVKKTPVIRRINIEGPYAVVLTGGGKMEGFPVDEPILVQRFSFGWQPLSLLNFHCALEAYAFGAHVDALLSRGMPMPKGKGSCKSGKPLPAMLAAEAVRKLMRGPLVPYVAVSGNWALGSWYGRGGGVSLYEMHQGNWKLVTSGGGSLGIDGLIAYGVPRADACKLMGDDAKRKAK